MWLMPSYGRPEALHRLLDAPGGWPELVLVLVNEDDPERIRYHQALDRMRERSPPWKLLTVPAGSRFCDAVRAAHEAHPQEPFYGIIDDDYWPVTPGWHEKMVAAAGPNGIAIANNKVNFPKPYCCRVMGGELARALGTITPGAMRHNFQDDTWGRIGEDFGVLRALEDVIVEHRHHLWNKDVPRDATYERGSGKDFDLDRRNYQDWLGSEERKQQYERVSRLLGGNGGSYSVVDTSKVHLVVAVPSGRFAPDLEFHQSYDRMKIAAAHHNIRLTTVYSAGASHLGKTRERLLWLCMETDGTHFLFIDDDMGWEERLPFRLIAADVDFACAVGLKKQDEPALCCNFYPGPQVLHPVNRFVKVRDVGFAFVMLKRAAVDRMVAAYPELAYDAGKNPDGSQRTEYALFLDLLEDRQRLSEDYSFCRRWTAIGGEIWADRQARLKHAGRKVYGGYSIDDLFQGAEKVQLSLERA